MANNGFVFLASYWEAIKELPDEDQLSAYRALCQYGLYGEEPAEMTPIAKAIFTLTKPNIDTCNNRYKAAVENGKKGGRPRKQPKKNQSENQTENQTENQSENQTVNQEEEYEKEEEYESEDEKDSIADKPHRTHFVRPSVEEVREYCQSRGNSIDPQRFVDHYNSNGWMVGRTKMKDWKAAVHTWERNEYNRKDGTNGKNKRDNQETGWELPGVTRF